MEREPRVDMTHGALASTDNKGLGPMMASGDWLRRTSGAQHKGRAIGDTAVKTGRFLGQKTGVELVAR